MRPWVKNGFRARSTWKNSVSRPNLARICFQNGPISRFFLLIPRLRGLWWWTRGICFTMVGKTLVQGKIPRLYPDWWVIVEIGGALTNHITHSLKGLNPRPITINPWPILKKIQRWILIGLTALCHVRFHGFIVWFIAYPTVCFDIRRLSPMVSEENNNT